MTATDTATTPSTEPSPHRSYGVEIVVGLVVLLFVAGRFVSDALDVPALQTWSTIFVSITIQALPFLVLGVVISGAIAAFVSAGLVARVVPRNPTMAVGAATMAGVLLPGCECGSVPISERLIARVWSPPPHSRSCSARLRSIRSC